MDRTMGITVRPDPSTVPRFPQLTDNPTNNLIPATVNMKICPE